MFCIKCGAKMEDDAKFCPQCGQVTANEKNAYNPASMGKRFLNFFIDSIIFGILSAILISFFVASKGGNELIIRFYGILLTFILYLIFEFFWQKTPGKFLTKTKVVTFEGEKPEFSRILGRTLARWIPFEALSFLTRSNPVGWHDKLSKTMVVPKEYSKEDVRKIDKTKIPETKIWLIVILVFFVGIIIIGLLSTLALVSLNSARVKARDARRMSDASKIQVALELYFTDIGSYPSSLIPGKVMEYNGRAYFEMPNNPLPSGSGCPENFEYEYEALEEGKSYEFKYCLEEGSEKEGSGIKVIHPNP